MEISTDYDFQEAERMLLKWARFTRGSGCAGWSSKSVTGALMDQYEVGIKNEGDFAVEHIPDDVALVDSIVAKLPGTTKKVMTVYWFNSNAPREVHGRIMRCSGRHFERLLKAAMLVFVARLSAVRVGV